MLDYILKRLNEVSTYIAIALLVLAVLFLPRGLTAFIIVGISIFMFLGPDVKISQIFRKLFR